MVPILLYARFARPLKFNWRPFYELSPWLGARDGYLIAAWGDSIWALAEVRDLDEAFSELKGLLSERGLDDLSFLEVGSRAWSFERAPSLQPGIIFAERFIAYDVEPDPGDDEAPESDEPTAESVFGPAVADDYDDDYEEPDEAELIEARMRGLEWPVTSWRAAPEYGWPDDRRRDSSIDGWFKRPFQSQRPKWGPKALLLILRDDRKDVDNVVERLRLALGPEAKIRCHGRRSLLILGQADYGPEQICEIENVGRRMRENRFLTSACFEIGPEERTLHLSVQGALIPPRTSPSGSTLALESQNPRPRWRRNRKG